MTRAQLTAWGFSETDLPTWDRVDESVVKLAAQMRQIIGAKPIITSGYRSPAQNQSAQGVKNSQHMVGRALDLVFPGVDPRKVIQVAENLGAKGLALQYPTGSVHIDTRTGNKARWGEKVEKVGDVTVKSHNHALAEILALFGAGPMAPPKVGPVSMGPVPIPQTTAGRVSAGIIAIGAIILLIILLRS